MEPCPGGRKQPRCTRVYAFGGTPENQNPNQQRQRPAKSNFPARSSRFINRTHARRVRNLDDREYPPRRKEHNRDPQRYSHPSPVNDTASGFTFTANKHRTSSRSAGNASA